jgi:PKD repeat protein
VLFIFLMIQPSGAQQRDACVVMNLLNNGGFETGDLSGWEPTGPGLRIESGEVYQGAFAAHITQAVQASQAWIAVEPGKTYLASAWFRWSSMTDDDWGYSHFTVNDGSYQEIASIKELDKSYAPGTWHKIALTFVPPTSQIMITFGIFGPETSVDYSFDEITVFEKAENSAPVIDPQVDTLSGQVPLTVNFVANADDPDGAVALHRWQFGDGSESREANPAHTYLSGGEFIITYTAYDSDGAAASKTLAVSVADPMAPEIVLSQPFTGDSYTTDAPAISLVGEARSARSAVASLIWDNLHTGEAASLNVQAEPSVPWQAEIRLKPGLNEILLTATDDTRDVGTKRLRITRQIAGPSISNITANTTTPAVYELYELTFDVETVADYPLFMYDPQPPPGAEQYSGVSVEGIITTPSGATVTHPAFYNVDVLRESERYFLTGVGNWKLRIAPLEPGMHRVSLRVTDQSGTQTVDAGSFEAQPAASQGYIQVARSDPRYFEFTNGDLYWPLGLTWAGTSGTSPDGIDLSHTVLNYDRPWMGGTGAYSTNWARWISGAEDHGNEGFSSHLSFAEHYPSSELSQHIQADGAGFRLWLSCWLDNAFCANVEAGKTYQLKLRAKTVGLSGPNNPDNPFGLTIKNHDWIGFEEEEAFSAALRDHPSWIPPIQQDTDWHTVVSTVTAQSDDDDFSIYLENVSSGAAFVDEFSVREVLPDGALGPEIIRNPKADMHTYVEQRPMAFWDEQIRVGEQNHIYLRLVVHDKNDWIQNHLDAESGSFVEQGDGYYQPENTRATWLQKQWWRYLIARLGYSPAVFSWELNNEGPPDDGTGTHARHAQLFGKWMHDLDGHPHLVSTSFWCCWEPGFWGDHEQFPDVDFADIHHYGAPVDMVQWYLDDARQAADSQIGKPVVRGETGIVDDADHPNITDALKQPNPGIWYHNLLWSQLDYSSMFDIGYWFSEQIAGFQREDHLRPFYYFVKDLDINQGGYGDLQAASDSDRLRVLGQKNLQSNKAYGWINHRDHTWKNVMDNGLPPAVSASIYFQMNPNVTYTVVWYDTYSGQTVSEQTAASDNAGTVTLQLGDLVSDIAFKVSPA